MGCPRTSVTAIYMDCPQMPVITELHGLSQDACHYTITWPVPGYLSVHTYMGCCKTPVTAHLHDCHKMTVSTHQHGLSPGYPSLYIYMDSLGRLSLHTYMDCTGCLSLYIYIMVPGRLSLYIYVGLSWESLVLGVRCLNSKPAHVLALHFGIFVASWST